MRSKKKIGQICQLSGREVSLKGKSYLGKKNPQNRVYLHCIKQHSSQICEHSAQKNNNLSVQAS